MRCVQLSTYQVGALASTCKNGRALDHKCETFCRLCIVAAVDTSINAKDEVR